MSNRIESPSSINTYRQCPKKYWFLYIKGLKSKATIHTTRGNIVHDVLEQFFMNDWMNISSYETCKEDFKQKTQELLVSVWKGYSNEMASHKLTEEDNAKYFEESMLMLFKWMDRLSENINKFNKVIAFPRAFNLFAPHYTEREYTSKKLKLRGKIDAVHKFNGHTIIKDYKTSSSTKVDDKLELQAAIYALLYKSTYHQVPNRVCFDFLKFETVDLEVTNEMLDKAIGVIKDFHNNTKTQDEKDYPIKTSGLCKWRTGECDFYETCNPFRK